MKTRARETGVDLERFRLKSFLEDLRASGELEVVAAPAELAEIAPALEGNAKAVLFERVAGEGASLAGNVMGSRARLARAFGANPDALLAEVLRRLRTAPQVVEVPREAAPAQEVVLEGEQADLHAIALVGVVERGDLGELAALGPGGRNRKDEVAFHHCPR